MFRALALVTLLAGCAQIFDLEEGAVEPVDELRVRVDYTYRYARNRLGKSAPTVQVEDHVFGDDELEIEVMLDDGVRPPTVETEHGIEFQRVTADQGYLVTVTDGGHVTTYQHHAANLNLVKRAAGRRVNGPRNETNLVFPQKVSTTAFIATTGQWTHSLAEIDDNGVAYTPWSNTISLGEAELAELDGDAGDYAYALGANTIQGTRDDYFSVIAAGGSYATTGQEDVLLAPLLPVTPIQCVDVEIHNETALDKLGASSARPSRAPYGDWRIIAVPEKERIGPLGEIWVAWSPFADVDATDRAAYVHAIAGHDYIAEAYTTVDHDLMLPTTSPLTVSSLLRRYSELVPDVTTMCGRADLDSGLGMPEGVMVAGVPLVADLQPLRLPQDGFVDITWPEPAGFVDQVSVTVYELSVGEEDSTVTTAKITIVADTTPIFVPASTFISGATYALVVGTMRGLPEAKEGDFSVIAYPWEQATVWSQAFVADSP